MPVLQLPVDATQVVSRITELETDGHLVVSVQTVGDSVLVVYAKKPQAGRPKKVETR